MPTQEEVREALRTVEDPELHIGIIDLGLIYGVEVAGEHSEEFHERIDLRVLLQKWRGSIARTSTSR